MTDFNPGDGWREWNFDTDRGRALSRERVQWTDASGFDHFFVRVGPVPPLPTEPYTVIRVTWRKGGHATLMCGHPLWWWVGTPEAFEPPALDITAFEVLAEPRAVTAKAVLDRIQALPNTPLNETVRDQVAREFGVES